MDDEDERTTRLLQARVPAALHAAVQRAADEELISSASWIRRAIAQAVRQAKGASLPPDQIYQPSSVTSDTESETPPVSELSIVDPGRVPEKARR